MMVSFFLFVSFYDQRKVLFWFGRIWSDSLWFLKEIQSKWAPFRLWFFCLQKGRKTKYKIPFPLVLYPYIRLPWLKIYLRQEKSLSFWHMNVSYLWIFIYLYFFGCMMNKKKRRKIRNMSSSVCTWVCVYMCMWKNKLGYKNKD